MPTLFSRRRLFKNCVGWACIFLTHGPTCALAKGLTDFKSDPFQQKVARFFKNKKSAIRLGLAYLDTLNDRLTATQLAGPIFKRCGTNLSDIVVMEEEVFRIWISQQIREDFAMGRTLRLYGWVLSDTELRLCALATMADQPLNPSEKG